MILSLLCTALSVYSFVLLIRIILSWVTMAWVPPPSLGPIIQVIYDLTEPVLRTFRGFIPPIGGLDLSPLIIFLLISVIRGALGC